MTEKARRWSARGPISPSSSSRPRRRADDPRRLRAFRCEVSVVAARSLDGSFAAYDVCENVHERPYSARPTRRRASCRRSQAAVEALPTTSVNALDYVGVLAVEMFVARDAAGGARACWSTSWRPRVHNSGHWTIDGAQTSQFEQHIRAICGWPLGPPGAPGADRNAQPHRRRGRQWREILAEPGVSSISTASWRRRPGRKMGHVTRILPTSPAAETAPDRPFCERLWLDSAGGILLRDRQVGALLAEAARLSCLSQIARTYGAEAPAT